MVLRDGDELQETRTLQEGAFSPDAVVITVLGRGVSARVPAELGAGVRVGKAPDNDLVVQDDTVSRYHLVFVRTEQGVELRDLKSTNGVRVGGARVERALVGPGTLVRAGEVELLVRVDPAGVQIPPSESASFGRAIGAGIAMRGIFGMLERVAPTSATVLLLGETGTGKDVLAHAIHDQSPRAAAPFEVVDCAAVAPALIESELFGHERGAFTGAVSARAGAFERAPSGTLFLDELGELPLELQPQLLRVLEAREVRRVGGTKTIPVDVRIVAAPTRDLAREVRNKRFREDLYFRLAVVCLQVPPLRERLEDIPLLVARILESASAPNPSARALRVPDETIAHLRAHDWPGNVRELRNVVERAAVVAQTSGEPLLKLYDFPGEDAQLVDSEQVFRYRPGLTWREARARVDAVFERTYLRWLLDRHGGNVSAAAREARLDRKYLAEIARRHDLMTPKR
ncbi:MAG: hypothetical protein NVSMB47_00320 [Polyangiales bacterium]